tara:strand:- start:16956 stop:17912 length:957 start_codon:yes stop_codon:yes gene_type:complete
MSNLTKTLSISENNEQILTARIFAKILYKINFSKKKVNQRLLGIDLLKTEIQKDLLSITTLRVEETYTKLFLKDDPEAFMQKEGKTIFLQCIKKSCEDFFTKQYGYNVKINSDVLKKSLYTKNLLADLELLFQIPFYVLKDPKSPIFNLVYYPVYNYASEGFIEALIDNIILEISNCVVYFSILKFSSIYTFRQTLYRSKFLSLRNFERFKNNLIWQLLIKVYVQHPVEVYNNRYEIFILRTSGIYCQTIYANRSGEITSLNNVSLITVTFIELKDFITSRLDELIYLISKGLRFTLTSVFGQVIGLVWRGVIEGLKK